MRVLVIGSGGREHALVDAISRDSSTKIYCAPGNAGIAIRNQTVDCKTDDFPGLLKYVDDNKIDLTVVGPEQPLAAGVVDAFEARGKLVFGPERLAARLETSKVFAKDFMKRWKIPTAAHKAFSFQQRRDLSDYLKSASYPLVLKADGLAAGKGVSIVGEYSEAEFELDKYFVKKIFGRSGEQVVVEEFMTGVEASVFAITDGKDYVILPAAQDHKRIGENDTGKNTGGMGSYAPTPFLGDNELKTTKAEIIEKVIEGTNAEGFPFKGCLYCGLMLTDEGVKVVEFNVRFGDPETQVVLQLIDSSVLDLLQASATAKIGSYNLQLNNAAAVCVIAASRGYPDEYEMGKVISGLEVDCENTRVFHSGSKRIGSEIVTSGGRVLGVTGIDYSGSITGAAELAYKRMDQLTFDGIYFRRDIAKNAVEFEKRNRNRK